MNIMRLLNPIALVLVIVGALNWGLVGLFEFDLVAEITGDTFGETNASPVVPSTEDGARASAVATGGRLRASRGLVRCRETRDRVALTILGRGPTLLRFGGAEVVVGDDAVSCTYRIRGGLLSL